MVITITWSGNLGLNYKYKTSEKEPFEIYSNDFDVDGKSDIVLGYGENGKNYPVNGFDATVRQLPVHETQIQRI